MRAERMADTVGRTSSLSDLYVRQLPSAIGLAFLLIGDRSLAEDIAQEAFVRLTGRFGHIRSPEGFDAYLRKTVVNLCLSNLRHRRVERSFTERALGQAPPLPPEMPDVTLQEELWEALRQLPHRQRAAVVLRYFEDLSERQSAEILRCSVPALRSLVARAMDSLRQLIRGDQDG